MWPRTDFLELPRITHPIVQAPMSGFTPPALAAAVCNAGGGLAPATVRAQVIALHRRQTVRPICERGSQVGALRNRFITQMADSEPLDFPLQTSLVGPLSQVPSEEARRRHAVLGRSSGINDQRAAGRSAGRQAR
jgi:NAD(P)H-dependent flavin oxidoreductase YrpB (nitropropane dioxygenase family)